MSFLNFKVKGLGIAEGWPSRIPEDADVLMIAGPTVAFSKEAQSSIIDFIEKKKESFNHDRSKRNRKFWMAFRKIWI
ncbi:hypothetical protein LEP1GSC170_4100 [Leptospira interrogans serovar Bataviae str. HAI135]|nr:hypothetical protein LEP1GSC170_4100 [Leptospira interrogans serovar Bataviae str. HAI135]